MLRQLGDDVSAAFTPDAHEWPQRVDADWLADTWTPTAQESVECSMTMLGKCIELLKTHRVACIVAAIPHYPQFTGQASPRPHEILAQTARRHGVPFLDLYRALQPQIAPSRQGDYYWDRDPIHFNGAGNRLCAEAFLGKRSLPTSSPHQNSV
jgi:lysophospholipase L1-like esterase